MQNGLGKGETMHKYVHELTALGRTSEPEVRCYPNVHRLGSDGAKHILLVHDLQDVAKAVSFLVSTSCGGEAFHSNCWLSR